MDVKAFFDGLKDFFCDSNGGLNGMGAMVVIAMGFLFCYFSFRAYCKWFGK